MNITVYLGASFGNDPMFQQKTQELGFWIAQNGHKLIYGGSECGLMGVIAKAVMESGGEAIGVEPRFFVNEETQYDGLTELIVTEDMTERKAKMIELGDAFIAMPGGTGTLEEIAEVMSKVSLRHINAPCIFYNINGFYDSMKALLERMTAVGLSSEHKQQGIYFVTSLDEIKEIIARYNKTA